MARNTMFDFQPLPHYFSAEHEQFRSTVRGTRSERICREVKVMKIGGGSGEIMKDLAARQLGI